MATAPSLEVMLSRTEAPLRDFERAVSLPSALTSDGFRAHRKALGLTQRKMSAELGISQAWLGRMERGVATIERRTALAVLSLHFRGDS